MVSPHPTRTLQERWPWGSLRIGSWLLPSFLALAVAGLLLATLLTTTAAVLLGRNPLLPLALAAIGVALFVAQGFWRRRARGLEQHAVLPTLLLLFGAWALLLRAARLPLLPTLDLLSLGIAMQLGMGRLGCTLAGCCYGLPSSWGLLLPADCGLAPAGVRRLPVALLEAGGWLLIAVATAFALAAAPPGTALALLLLLYGLLRSALEPLRGDPVRRWRGLRPAQLQAGLCAAAGFALAWQLRQRQLPAALNATDPYPFGMLALLLLGLLSALVLLVRRDLWSGGVRQLTLERQRGIERFAHWLLNHPPQRQVRVHALEDLKLGVCRLGWGAAREWQISVRRLQPPLCRAEAEWILHSIAAVFPGRMVSPPLVLAGSESLFLMALPDPTLSVVEGAPRARVDEHGADPAEQPHYFQPLLPHTLLHTRP
ncbi:MAG: prolipoprotein diacylglyceryl transferase family protein [Cyanobium sp.]